MIFLRTLLICIIAAATIIQSTNTLKVSARPTKNDDYENDFSSVPRSLRTRKRSQSLSSYSVGAIEVITDKKLILESIVASCSISRSSSSSSSSSISSSIDNFSGASSFSVGSFFEIPIANSFEKIEKSKRLKMRMVVGTVPVSSDRKRVLLISSRRHPEKWIFPKGGLESEFDVDEKAGAARETFEEAGVIGTVGPCLTKRVSNDGKTHFTFYEMVVQREEEQWPESDQRQRKWVLVQDVAKFVKKDVMLEAFSSWLRITGIVEMAL